MIAGLRPYPSDKDSGVPWLGGVPEHWPVGRLKSRCTNVIEQTSYRRPGELYVALQHVEGWSGRLRIADDDVAFDSQVNRFRANDILFGKLRPYLAKVARPELPGVCVGEFFVLRPQRQYLLPEYLEHLLRSRPIIDVVNSSTFGAKMPRADWQFVGSVRVPFPPLAEQAAIARFLDHADRRIQRYIRAKKKLIALLNEQKQAIIHQAVTRGLDPDVRLKPSGVEWLGDVPEHWEVLALRHRYSQALGKMLDSKRIVGSHLLPYLRNVDVQWDHINAADLPVMDVSPDEYDRYTVKLGDLLVCEGGEVGRAAIWHGQLEICGFQKAIHRLRPTKENRDAPRHLLYALRAAAATGAFRDGHESTISHLTGDKLRAHRFAFPPKDEQVRIVAHLDEEIGDIEQAAGLAHREIDLMLEYRTRLISDVVTGKLDVREAAAKLPDEAEDLEPLDDADMSLDGDEYTEDIDLDASLEEVAS